MRWFDTLQRSLLIIGLVLIGIYLCARTQQLALSRAEIQRFNAQRADTQNADINLPALRPDFSLWSGKRIHDYEESLAAHFSPAVAVLRIPRIALEVPVLPGTDELTLNRAVGLIEGTALPGDDGNVGIAGHRDGFFRGLKDVRQGDTVEVATQEETLTYVIDGISVVDPNDVSVLASREQPSLTLVTCYPFYWVGSAPKRYIVKASLKQSVPVKDLAAKSPNSKPTH
jgi:sortase A